MKRFVAVLAAVAMVLLAVLVRGVIDRDRSGGEDAGGSDAMTIVCGPELLAACNVIAQGTEGVSVTVQAEQDTADALAGGELELGENRVWLAAADWPAITTAGGTQMPELASSETLARSPAVMVARNDRLEVLRSACDALDWSCVGDAAGAPWTDLGGDPRWGQVEVGLPEVASAPGTVAVNQAVASRVGSSDFATNDLTDPAVLGWFERLAEASGANTASAPPLVELIRRPGSLSVVGALESDAVVELTDAASADTFGVVAPAPVATADVHLWGPSSAAVAKAIERLDPERLASALSDTGWRTGDDPGDPSAPPGAASIGADMQSLDTALPGTGQPDDSGLPSPGTMFSVNTRWRDSQ